MLSVALLAHYVSVKSLNLAVNSNGLDIKTYVRILHSVFRGPG